MGCRFENFSEWHKLFDALCIEHSHLDNAKIAGEYCDLTKKKSDNAYESALKSLNNWRLGLHTPSRRNFRILTSLLHIEEAADTLPHWNRLYEEAQRRKPSTEPENGTEDSTPALPGGTAHIPASPRRSIGWPIAAAIALVGIGFAGGSIATLQITQQQGRLANTAPWKPSPAAAPPTIDVTGQRIPYRDRITLKVGQSAVIHGARGACGEQPPPWNAARWELPPLYIGAWSDGGIGYRISRACDGPTPARAVVFTAINPGEESIVIFNDPVLITVEQ